MDKVYLLLRDNTETGPYSFDEITKKGLRPTDLIWIEKQSHGWTHPSDLEIFKPVMKNIQRDHSKALAFPHLSHLEMPSERTSHQSNIQPPLSSIYVSLPAHMTKPAAHQLSPEDLLEQQAEELKKRVTAYTLKNPVHQTDTASPGYSRVINNLENEYASWLYLQESKKKKVHLVKTGAKVLLWMLLLGEAFILAKDVFQTKDTPINKQAFDTKSIQATVPVSIKKSNTAISEVSLVADSEMTDASLSSMPIPALSEKDIQQKLPEEKSKTSIASTSKSTVKILKKQENALVNDYQPVTFPQSNIHEDLMTNIKEDTQDYAVPEKKKTLGDKLNDLFKIKRKKESTPEKAHITDTYIIGTMQRVDGMADMAKDNLASLVNVTYAYVLNRSTSKQDLQLTLKNNSSKTITTAVVEMQFYNKNNDVISKKLIHFNDVPSKESVSVIVDDNLSADHTYYNLLSASN